MPHSSHAESNPPRNRVLLTIGVLGALGCAAALAGTVAGFLGRVSWILSLFDSFRFAYCLWLAAWAVLFLVFKRRVLGGTCALGALVNAWVIVAALGSSTPEHDWVVSASGSETVLAATDREAGEWRLLFANLLTTNRERHKVRDLVLRTSPDIILAVEPNEAWLHYLQQELPDYVHHEGRPRDDNFGIATFSRHPLEVVEFLNHQPAGVDSLYVRVVRSGQAVDFVVTHPLSPQSRWGVQNRDTQLGQLGSWSAARTGNVPLIVVGDFNIVPWSPPLRALLEQSGLRRVGHGQYGTWPARLPGLLRIPIDYALVSPRVTPLAFSVGPRVGSDHRPLCLDFRID